MRSFPDSVRCFIAIVLLTECVRLVTGELESSQPTASEEVEVKAELDEMLNYALNITDRQNFVFNSSFSSSSTFCFSPTGEKGKCKPLSLCPSYHGIIKQLKTPEVVTFFRERICRLLHTSVLICCPFGKPVLPFETRSPEVLPLPLPQQHPQPQFTPEKELETQTQPEPMLNLQPYLQTKLRSQLRLREESQPQPEVKEKLNTESQNLPQVQQPTEQESQPRFEQYNPKELRFQTQSQFQLQNQSRPQSQSQKQPPIQSLPETDLHSHNQSHLQSDHQEDPHQNLQPHSSSVTSTDVEFTETAENTEMPESFTWLRWSTRLLEMFLLICLIAFLLACLFISLFFLFFRDLFMLLASVPHVPDELPLKK